MVDRDIRGLINQFKEELRKNRIQYEYIFLFGSYAAGKAKKHSDIDIAVISAQFGKNRLKERIMLMKISAKVDFRIEPHPVSLKDWQENWKCMVSEIKQTGIQIPA